MLERLAAEHARMKLPDWVLKIEKIHTGNGVAHKVIVEMIRYGRGNYTSVNKGCL